MTSFDPIKFKQTTREQWDTAAEAWHRWAPTLRTWLGATTERMLDLANVHAGCRVLDIAAGAGDQTLHVAARVGHGGSVLATDISAGILEFAAAEARRAGHTNVQTRVMDAENLDLPDASFDVVVSRLGLMYFPDQHRALVEMKRVLVPGGRAAVIVFAPADKNGFFSIPVSIVRRHANLGPPLPGQPGPFSLGAAGVIEDAFTRAGFRDVKAETIDAPVRLPSVAECVRFEQESFGALHQMLTGLSPAAREAAWQEVATALRAFEVDGRFVGACQLVVAVGTN